MNCVLVLLLFCTNVDPRNYQTRNRKTICSALTKPIYLRTSLVQHKTTLVIISLFTQKMSEWLLQLQSSSEAIANTVRCFLWGFARSPLQLAVTNECPVFVATIEAKR